MDIREKYNRLRPQIKNGSIILVRGKSFLARGIEWADCAYYSHALLVFKVGNRLFAIQAMAEGVCPSFLSTEVFNNRDFCIINPKVPKQQKDFAVEAAFEKAELGIPYNFTELLRILLKERLGIKFKSIQGNPHENICSVFTFHTYASLIPLYCYIEAYKAKGYLTPEDGIRYANLNEVDIIGDDSNPLASKLWPH